MFLVTKKSHLLITTYYKVVNVIKLIVINYKYKCGIYNLF